MNYADQALIRQTLLDEHHGNVTAAFEDACARLATAYHGVSWAYMRRMVDTDGVIVADPYPVDDGAWLTTGKERHA